MSVIAALAMHSSPWWHTVKVRGGEQATLGTGLWNIDLDDPSGVDFGDLVVTAFVDGDTTDSTYDITRTEQIEVKDGWGASRGLTSDARFRLERGQGLIEIEPAGEYTLFKEDLKRNRYINVGAAISLAASACFAVFGPYWKRQSRITRTATSR